MDYYTHTHARAYSQTYTHKCSACLCVFVQCSLRFIVRFSTRNKQRGECHYVFNLRTECWKGKREMFDNIRSHIKEYEKKK